MAATTTKKTRADDPEVRVLASKPSSSSSSSALGGRLVEPSLAAIDALDVDSVVAGLCNDVRPLGGALGMIDWRLCGRLSRLLEQGTIKGDDGEKVLFPTQGRIPSPRIFLYGWGSSVGLASRAADRVAAMVDMVDKAGAKRVAFVFPEPARSVVDVAALQVEKLLGDRLVVLFGADPLPPV